MTKSAEAAGKLLREHVLTEASPSVHAANRARFTDAASGSGRPRRRTWYAVALAAAAMAFTLWFFTMRPAERVAFTVGNDAPGEIGAFYSPVAQEELTLRFRGGGTVRLAPAAGARVSSVGAQGATLLIETGRAHVDVATGPDTAWQVVAGPYTIRLTGTAFWVSWTTEANELEVVMERGAVVVRGPRLESGVTVTAGQRFVTRVTSRLEPDAAGSVIAVPSNEPPPPAPSSAADDKARPRQPTPAQEAAADEPEPRWNVLLARGEHRRVVEAAEARGIDTVLASGSLDDVAALADAARFTGRGGIAQRALNTLRSRFPGSSRAKSAAFVLGRMLDDGGNPSGALSWYDTYLSEAPGGALAAEALGRRMLALQRLGRADEALRSAEDYLKRFPKGPYAAQAEKLVSH
jgi:TolA-binding protein